MVVHWCGGKSGSDTGVTELRVMTLINAREGAYAKHDAPGLRTELMGLAIPAAIFVVALLLHPYFAGVASIPR